MWKCSKCGEELAAQVAVCWSCGTREDGTQDPEFVAEQAATEALPSPAALPEEPPLDRDARRRLWAEVGVVLCIAVFPDVFVAISRLIMTPSTEALTGDGRTYRDSWLLGRSIFVSIPILYLIWRSNDDWQLFGIVKPRWGFEVFLASLVLIVSFPLCIGFEMLLDSLWVDAGTGEDALPADEPLQWSQTVLFVTANLANGFAEELAMRAYLIVRLRRLLGSTLGAVVVSSLLFGSYHLWQGPVDAIGTVFTGVCFAGAFLWLRRLWPIALAHAGHNFTVAVIRATTG